MRLNIFTFYLVSGLLWFLQPEVLFARDAPITMAGSSTACPGSAVIVPITVTNFTAIEAITLRVDCNPSQLAFIKFANINPAISGLSLNYIPVNDTLAKIMIAWASINPLTLPDGTKLLDINFTLTAGSPVISFNNTSNGGSDCEYADEHGRAMNDLPDSTFYINSTITNLGVEAAGTITGAAELCAGSGNIAYSVPLIAGATGYAWTVPVGATIVSGDNSPSIVVNYAVSALSGNIKVAGTNGCGTGAPSSLPVTIYPLPVPVLIGLDTACSGSSGLIYSTDPGMTNYFWSISGGMITAGNGADSVTVSWVSSGTQTISVNYAFSNGCTADTPTSKDVSVDETPSAPVVTANGALLTSSALTGNQWYYEGTAIPGETGQTFTVTENTGNYWCVVTINGCTSPISNMVWVVNPGVQELQDNNCSVYPVPNDGKFTVFIDNRLRELFSITVYNQTGEKVYELKDVHFIGISRRYLDIGPVPNGIYSVVLSGPANIEVKKILISH